jgi:hypothetical protein
MSAFDPKGTPARELRSMATLIIHTIEIIGARASALVELEARLGVDL